MPRPFARDRRPSIDGYEDLELIGRGGYSRVYRARQPAFDRAVAVKVITATIADADVDRFAEELRITGRLDGHPHVIRVYDSGRTRAGRPFLSMELFEDGSYAAWVRRHGPLRIVTKVPYGAWGSTRPETPAALERYAACAHAAGSGSDRRRRNRPQKPERHTVRWARSHSSSVDSGNPSGAWAKASSGHDAQSVRQTLGAAALRLSHPVDTVGPWTGTPSRQQCRWQSLPCCSVSGSGRWGDGS